MVKPIDFANMKAHDRQLHRKVNRQTRYGADQSTGCNQGVDI